MAGKQYLISSEYFSLGIALVSGHIKDLVNCHWSLVGVLSIGLLLLYNAERKIHNNIQLYPWKFRSNTSPGLWCSCLLPAAIFVTQYRKLCSSNVYLGFAAAQSFFLLLSSLLFIFENLNIKNVPWKDHKIPVIGLSCAHGISRLIILIGLNIATNQFFVDWNTAILSSIAVHFIFATLLLLLLRHCPLNFTLGEVLVLSQALTLFTVMSTVHLVSESLSTTHLHNSLSGSILFAETCLLGCLIVCIVCASVRAARTSLGFVCAVGGVGIVFVIPVGWMALKENPVIWFINYILFSKMRLLLLGSWFVIFLIAITTVVHQLKLPAQPTTIMRKYFHLFIIMVYVPGLVYDVELLGMFSSLLLGVFLLLECLRYFEISPIGPVLNDNLKYFLDEKDEGLFILSHVYLLVGCATPIWLQASSTGSTVAVYAGLLSIAIGDAAASIAGIKYGYHHWPGNVKTVEGTAASIGSQMVAFYVLKKTGAISAESVTNLPIVIAIVVTSLLETFTSQIDNAVIPLVFYAAVG